MKILLLHGPNLNLLGSREPQIYGSLNSEELLQNLQVKYPEIEMAYFQSNHESELIDEIQKANTAYNGILINAGAFAHTSIAISDAVKAIQIPVINVHISNTEQRETYRKTDLLADACEGSIVGLGTAGYSLALECLFDLMEGK